MAKTLKDFLEGYLNVKSADEQKFVDKHVTAKNPDRNGNGDNVFNGSTKTIDRRKDRKGYNPGEDEKVYEALTGNQHKIDANKNGKVDAHDFKLLRSKGKWASKSYKDADGKWTSKDVKEEAEALDEISAEKKDAYAQKAGKQLSGLFANSRKSADGARKYYNRKNTVRKIANEEAEALDELSKPTLSSYVKKAASSAAMNAMQHGKKTAERDEVDRMTNRHMSFDDKDKIHKAMKTTHRDVEEPREKAGKRIQGIGRASARLAKEEAEIQEKLNMDKASMGTVVKDFQKSDAPQFRGKSPAKRRVMAIAAKLSAERGGKPLSKEERLLDRLDDISESHQRVMLEVFEKLSEDNKSKFMEACDTPTGVEQMLDFAINNRGE